MSYLPLKSEDVTMEDEMRSAHAMNNHDSGTSDGSELASPEFKVAYNTTAWPSCISWAKMYRHSG